MVFVVVNAHWLLILQTGLYSSVCEVKLGHLSISVIANIR